MKSFQVWSEGYSVTGNSSQATYWGVVEAEDFKSAAQQIFQGTDDEQYFDSESLTFWGCKLFDNEYAARKSFG